MGSNSWTHVAAWTFFYLMQVLTADRSLFQDLGLSTIPDITKINISQDEYSKMMTTYLNSRQSLEASSVPLFVTFKMVKREWYKNKKSLTHLKFPIKRQEQKVDVDSAQLRILAAPYSSDESKCEIYQVMGLHRRRLLEEKIIYLSKNLTKWCEFDVTSAVQAWLDGDKNLGLEILCSDSSDTLNPLEASISALIHKEHRRYRRSNSPYQPLRRTDCRESRRGNGKKRCCRHNMVVKFADLKFPEMTYIIQPKFYEAGFCQGQCPPNYNHATNHSRIQSLMHQIDRKNKVKDHKPVPKACCAPSKLEPLEILRVNPADSTKLILEKWDNMQVVECACS